MPKYKKSSPNSRRRHTNSKLGCANCKRKKIRCDENLPVCDNCYRGKKETCSYLTLSEKEINRIKLTHSLRDSQNKLLNQNYRLPTSSSTSLSENYSGNSFSDVLEFVFEHSELPLRIPSMTYPTLMYNNLTIHDFGNEFKVITDDDSAIEQDAPVVPHALPGARVCRATFKVNKAYNEKINYYKSHFKFSIAGALSGILSDNCDRIRGALLDSVICFGRAIIFNYFNQKRKIPVESGSQVDMNFLDSLERSCLELHGKCVESLDEETKSYRALPMHEVPVANHMKTIINLCIAKMMMAGASILLNFSAEKYCNFLKDASLTILSLDFSNTAATECFVYEGLEKSLKYNIASVSIPRYDPVFFFELLENYKTLSYLFDVKMLRFESPILNNKFQKLCYYYNNLLNFMSDKVRIKINQEKEKKASTPESMHSIFNLLKTWYSIFPDEAMVFTVKPNDSMTDEEEYVDDLRSVLFAYYHAVSASLEALFPTCRYIFQAGFIATSTEYHYRKIKLRSKMENKYHSLFKKFVFTQHHVVFAARLFAFFKRRYKFYKTYVKWVNLFVGKFKMEDLNRRMVKNVREAQIASFNTTLIRPEHYPTSISVSTDVSDVSDFTFSRTDDSLVQKLYARNIEKLDFFNQSCVLQFDYDSMLLLRDYRPLEEATPTIDGIKFTPSDLLEYFSDVENNLLRTA